MPVYNSPRRVTITLVDDDGTERVATASRAYGHANLPRWDLSLRHPSGENWPGSFSGANIIDALTELVERKEHRYNESRNRGHRVSQMAADRNISIGDDGNPIGAANITTHNGQQVAFGKAAAALARARSEGR